MAALFSRKSRQQKKKAKRSFRLQWGRINLILLTMMIFVRRLRRQLGKMKSILKASLIYGAIVLMVMCLTVLALQQLLDAEKNNYRFSVLRKMGVEEKDLHTLVLKQLGVWFGMPITAAIVVAMIVIGYFLQSVSAEISAYIGCGALMRQIGIIVGIFALLLSCYFLSTWLLFQRSIRNNSNSGR